jgi:hypothetical protein
MLFSLGSAGDGYFGFLGWGLSVVECGTFYSSEFRQKLGLTKFADFLS